MRFYVDALSLRNAAMAGLLAGPGPWAASPQETPCFGTTYA